MVAEIRKRQANKQTNSRKSHFLFFTEVFIRDTASPDRLGDDPLLDFAGKVYLNMKPFETVLG